MVRGSAARRPAFAELVPDTAGPRWLDAATDLLRLAVPAGCAGLTPYDSPRFADFLAGAAALSAEHRTLIPRGVVSDGRLMGVADWRLLGRVLFLNGLAVAPDARRTGVGRSLLDDGLGLARELGCTALELDVAADNEAAAALYRGAGFGLVGTSTWTEVKPDPQRAEDGWRVRNWPAYQVHVEAYGFGDLEMARPGSAVTVRMVPHGWRFSVAEQVDSAAGAVAAVLGRVPARVFVTGKARVGTPIATFQRLRRTF